MERWSAERQFPGNALVVDPAIEDSVPVHKWISSTAKPSHNEDRHPSKQIPT